MSSNFPGTFSSATDQRIEGFGVPDTRQSMVTGSPSITCTSVGGKSHLGGTEIQMNFDLKVVTTSVTRLAHFWMVLMTTSPTKEAERNILGYFEQCHFFKENQMKSSF